VKFIFGWDPPTKRLELFHRLARYILIYGPQTEQNGSASGQATLPLVAYVGFRFEDEDGENVLYCYELQVSNVSQRHGLGKFLMQQLSNVGRHWQMQKVMLTVLKGISNPSVLLLA